MAILSVSLITYDIPHRKTQEILFKILRRGDYSVSLTIVPFKRRAERETLIQHRPDQFTGPSAPALASRFDLPIRPIEDWRLFNDTVGHFLICVGSLIEPEFCSAARIINCHPGLLPESRGLDAFKWAIHQGRMLGNTLHIIDEQIDAGQILHQERTPVFTDDDLPTLARRHYETEIELLSQFDNYLSAGSRLDVPPAQPTKRMPLQIEAEAIARFDDYKRAQAAAR
jgi:phosphoribosylglycinamide formyltransferase-1